MKEAQISMLSISCYKVLFYKTYIQNYIQGLYS